MSDKPEVLHLELQEVAELRFVSIIERYSMVCAPVRRDNPRFSEGIIDRIQAHKPCSISLIPV